MGFRKIFTKSLRVTGVVASASLAFTALGCSSTVEEPISDGQSDVPTVEEQARNIAEAMTLEEKVASVLMLHFPGLNAENYERWTATIQPAGLILMGDNTEDGAEATSKLVAAAQGEAQWPMLISVDQEGGTVSRLDEDPSVGANDLRDMDFEEVREQQEERAKFLHSIGINTNFGIVADVTDDPDFFIYKRVLGTTYEKSAENVAASVLGQKDGGVYTTVKHFPGHGAAAADSHNSIPQTDIEFETWEKEIGFPFQAGINAGVDMVMLGHLAYTDVSSSPASLSPEWVKVLRDDMEFKNVIVTDDMRMLPDSGLPEFEDGWENAVNALEAGVDLVLYLFQDDDDDPVATAKELVDTILAAVDEGRLSEKQLTESVERIMKLRLELE